MDKKILDKVNKGKYKPKKALLNRGDKFKNVKERIKDIAKKM